MSDGQRMQMQQDGIDPEEYDLQAYHDGELTGLARWRFERRLARSPELRRELAMLARMGDWVRESEPVEAPDLWDQIALRLPAEEARQAEAEAGRSRGGWWTPLLSPMRAAAAAAVAAVALAFGLMSGDTPHEAAVLWLDGGGHSVMVLEDSEEATIIWMLDTLPAEASLGGGGVV